MPVPDGWVQIIRGPRPPAERWPKIVRAEPALLRSHFGSRHQWRQNEKPPASVPPDVAAAKQRVGGLEAAVAALAAVGTVDGPEVHFLKEPENAHQCLVEPDSSFRRESAKPFPFSFFSSQSRLAN